MSTTTTPNIFLPAYKCTLRESQRGVLTRCEGCLWVGTALYPRAEELNDRSVHPADLGAGRPSRYVGNKIAVFAMQSLGCDVAALNTVQFSQSHHPRPFLDHTPSRANTHTRT